MDHSEEDLDQGQIQAAATTPVGGQQEDTSPKKDQDTEMKKMEAYYYELSGSWFNFSNCSTTERIW